MTKYNKQKKQKQSKSRIPEFASREEEAEFWDTHDIADYQDEFKTVQARFADRLSEGITIRFTPEVLDQLRTLAQERILEHLRGTDYGQTRKF